MKNILFSIILFLGITTAYAQEVSIHSLDGRIFESIEELDRGLAPNATTSVGKWTIKFSEETWEWLHFDYVEFGSYTMSEDGKIVAVRNKGNALPLEIEGFFDHGTQQLQWDGLKYRLSSQ